MDLRYFVLGVNIVLISALLIIYGFLINSSSLIGLSASALITGLVIITLGFSIREGLLNTLLKYSTMLTKHITTIIEDFDLLEATAIATKRDGDVYIVLAKSLDINALRPGIGFYKNTPYLAIPVNDLLSNVEKLGEINETTIETGLSEILIDEFSICKRIRVEHLDKTIKLSLIDIDDRIKGFLGYPLDPVTTLVIITLNMLINRDLVLRDRLLNLNNVVYVFEVVNRVETS